ncbi:MAG: NAD(P)/FAD-dependent oxidoreductase [Chitinophagales bacterium]|nr:NAD(P)/FAD-dependent oxidoreductase [Chitinophagales bacterium]
MKTTVVGAGLVGSLWAIYLAKRGYQVTLYERRPDMRKVSMDAGRSINLALSDRGLKALNAVGLEDDIRAMAIPMHGRMVHGQDGAINFQPYGLQGQFINSISRGGLNQLLMDKAELAGAYIHFGQRGQDVDLQNNVLLMEDGTKVASELLFGTDGAFSAIRTAMTKTDRFNYSQTYLEHGYKELSIPPTTDGGWQLEKNALHIWPRKSFMLIALPNLDGSFTCTLFLALEGSVSFAQLTDAENAVAFFETYFPDALALMPHFKVEFFQNPTSSLATFRCYPWSMGGRALLLGDAAHGIVPFYGQGMNAGFEDCTVLNLLMDEYGEDWSQIMPAFEKRRKPDTDAIAELALRNFIEMRDSVADERYLLRRKIEQAMQQQHPEEFLPLYSMVSFSHIPYSQALHRGQAYDQFFQSKPLEELRSVEQKLGTLEGNDLLDGWFKQLQAL